MKRIQRKRTPGFKLPKNTICVNRGTKFGNPFLVSYLGVDEAIRRFTECLINPAIVYTYFDEIEASIQYDRFKWMNENIPKLSGYDYLACFCEEDKPCHGDVLIEFEKKTLKLK